MATVDSLREQLRNYIKSQQPQYTTTTDGLGIQAKVKDQTILLGKASSNQTRRQISSYR